MTATAPDGLRTPSLRRRATVVVVVLVAALLVVLVVATELVLRERLDAQLRQRLVDRVGVAEALVGQVDDRDLARRLEGQGVSVVIVTADGATYAEGSLAGALGAGGPASDPAGPNEGPDAPPVGADPPGPAPPDPPGADPEVQESGDLLTVSRRLDDGSTLLLAADAGDVRDTVAEVRLVLLVAAGLVLLLTAVLVPLVVSGALRPLRTITGVARDITRGDRGRRLRPVSPHTELGRTAVAFDDMLDEVVGAEERAVASEARLRSFLSDAAHELRTPVAGVQATAEQLLRDDPPRAEREQALLALIRATRRAGRLVDDLLLMARIDRGLDLQRAEVDLAEVADEVLDERRHRHLSARLVREGGPLLVEGDHDRLVQVVANLVDNALQATGGQGQVVVRLDAVDDGAARLDVADDGPGVPPEQRERVFERLVRLENGHARPDGAGLGLPIARGIARSHGGDLVCLAAPSGGALFRLTLPPSSAGVGPTGPVRRVQAH
ncbi:hypothetical protein GCM10023340_35870 [Nocardioides marinquilinus]|uniref:histidine kinase n=1 Tax=Nocardioides marinquilinus TaxID=1210400 RepID=A0ABP9Q015_9ACTN